MIHILYIDDEPAILEIGKTLLEADPEFQVDTTVSVPDALSLLSTGIYEAVISDYLMPEMDGIRFLQLVRSINQKIPFIFFTGQATQSVVIKAINSGADFFLEKDQNPSIRFLDLSQLIRLGVRRYRTEKLLAESEEKYRQIIEIAAEGVWLIDAEDKTTFVNPRMIDMLGYSEEEMLGRTMPSFMAEQGKAISEHNIECLKRGIREQHDFEFSRKDGTRIYTSIQASPLTDERGQYTGALALVADITERKRTEQRLEFINAVLTTLKETTVEGILVVDESDEIINVNQRFIEMWKIPSEVMETHRARKVFRFAQEKVKDPEKFEAQITYLYEHPDERSREEVNLKDDTTFDVYSSPMVGTDGTCFGRVWYYHDITDQKRNEASILRLSSDNQTILDNVPAMIWYKDTQNRFIRVNQAVSRYFGKGVWEIEGKSTSELFPDLADQFYKDDLEIFSSGKAKLGIIEQMITASGEKRWVQTDKIPLRDEHANIIGLLVFGIDITDRRKDENATRLANRKLHLLSDITRHDILNQIQALFFYVESAEEDNSDPVVRETIKKIDVAVHNIQRQITFTRDYQDLGIKSPAWQDIHKTIDLAVRSLPLAPIEVKNEIFNVQVYADPLLVKVFYNLADNAKRYGGKITTIRFTSKETEGGLVIECMDDGVGIPEKLKTAIFNREYYVNTGFGLNISREILSITSIHISESGIPGEGARFEILVPKGNYRLTPA